MAYLILFAVIVVSLHAAVRAHRAAEAQRVKALAIEHWNRQQQDKHPWERDESWAGMEEPHRPRWTRRLKMVAKDTWQKEQARPVFKRRQR